MSDNVDRPRIDDEREQLLFGEVVDPRGIAYFDRREKTHGDPITTDTATTLLDRGYIEPTDRQNYGPTATKLVELTTEYDKKTPAAVDARICGYLIPAWRPDARITFTTFRLESDAGAITPAIQTDVAEEFKASDSVVRAWWD
jgi:hypothetical protein